VYLAVNVLPNRFGDAAPAAIFDAFTRIIQDVVQNNLQRKAIINLSTGGSSPKLC
jgi:hypothetical protein